MNRIAPAPSNDRPDRPLRRPPFDWQRFAHAHERDNRTLYRS